ncbi:hypothetical protein LTR94_036577, partial [Friedmanniomyces endolithicus]
AGLPWLSLSRRAEPARRISEDRLDLGRALHPEMDQAQGRQSPHRQDRGGASAPRRQGAVPQSDREGRLLRPRPVVHGFRRFRQARRAADAT